MLKSLAHSAYVVSVEQKGEEFKFTMYEKAKVKVDQIPALIQKYRGNLQFKIEQPNPYFIYQKKSRNKKEKDEDVIELVKNVLNDIKLLND